MDNDDIVVLKIRNELDFLYKIEKDLINEQQEIVYEQYKYTKNLENSYNLLKYNELEKEFEEKQKRLDNLKKYIYNRLDMLPY